MNRVIIIAVLLLFNTGCTSAEISDFQKSKSASDSIRLESSLLNSKYEGFTKEDFKEAFGEPKKIIKDDYPYNVNVNCSGDNCEEGMADELWVYEFLKKTERGKTFYSVYAYMKNSIVVRIK